MPWYEIPLVESIWREWGTITEPTNPSSLTLALVGVGTFLCYQILARPEHGRKRPIDLGQTVAKPQATAAESEDRRVA